jgi:hypothetical protein
MTETSDRLGASMTEWATGLNESGYADVAKQIDQNKLIGLRALEHLKLPHPPQHFADVCQFMASEQSRQADFAALGLERYFTILSPRNNTLRRFRQRSLTEDRVVDFVRSTLAPAEYDNYDLVLQDPIENAVYGGNILCEKGGKIEVEMVAGASGHNLLVSGGVTPQFEMWRDEHTGRFLYSFEDPGLRRALLSTVMSIPHSFDEDSHSPDYRMRGATFTVGYYEFFLLQSQDMLGLEPTFTDYSAQPAFRLDTTDPLKALDSLD